MIRNTMGLRKTIIKISLTVLILFLVYADLIEPFLIVTKSVDIQDENFVDFFKEYKTILMSDIHVSKLGIRENFLFKKINKISPDIIFITGDFVSWGGNYEKTFKFLSKLKANVGIWAVLGDSDYQNTRKTCIFCHAKKFHRQPFPVKFLRNQTIYLPVGSSKVAISGIELFQKDKHEAQQKIKYKTAYPEIILSHKQFNLECAGEKPVLVLSGDTHGGQIFMPALFWKMIFGKSKGEVRSGMISNGSKKLFVSKGIGTNGVPLRFFCPPEIILFKALP